MCGTSTTRTLVFVLVLAKIGEASAAKSSTAGAESDSAAAERHGDRHHHDHHQQRHEVDQPHKQHKNEALLHSDEHHMAQQEEHHKAQQQEASLLEGQHQHQHRQHHRHTGSASLIVRKRPSADAPAIGRLEQGDLFEVEAAHEGKDGAVWLELADKRGWVPQDKVVQVQPERAHAQSRSRSRHNRRRAASSPLRLSLADQKQWKLQKPYENLHMDQSKLPSQIKHVNGKTINSDWHNEYPMTDEPEATQSRAREARAGAVGLVSALLLLALGA